MVAVTLAASSAFASPRATSTTSSTVRPSPLTTTVRMATACHPPPPGAAAGPGNPGPPGARPAPAGRELLRVMSHDDRPCRQGNMETMTIAIAGGTGTLGRQVAAELEARGHKVRALSRHSPDYRVDLATGEGLGPALAGGDVVVDASNSAASKPGG